MGNEKRGLLDYAAGLGAMKGVNSYAQTSNAWIWDGQATTKGPYQNEFSNDSGQNLVLYCWGPAGSWVNAVAPLVSHPMAPNETVTVNYAEGASGACAAMYPDTTMVNGQIFNTWLEYTFAGVWSTYDVSREVNMQGRGISTQGPACKSDMNTCVFTCIDKSLPQCTTGYQLENCQAANGGGTGWDAKLGAQAGGCNGLTAGSGFLKTSLQ